jgi:hypothetical protein
MNDGIIMVIPFVNIKWPKAVKASMANMAKLPLNTSFQFPVRILDVAAVTIKTVTSTINGFIFYSFFKFQTKVELKLWG